MAQNNTLPAQSCKTLVLRNSVGTIIAAELVVVLEIFAACSYVRLCGNTTNEKFKVMNHDLM